MSFTNRRAQLYCPGLVAAPSVLIVSANRRDRRRRGEAAQLREIMITAIADYVKSRRNELGRHVLFVGHAVRTSPDELTVEDLLHTMAGELGRGARHRAPGGGAR